MKIALTSREQFRIHVKKFLKEFGFNYKVGIIINDNGILHINIKRKLRKNKQIVISLMRNPLIVNGKVVGYEYILDEEYFKKQLSTKLYLLGLLDFKCELTKL